MCSRGIPETHGKLSRKKKDSILGEQTLNNLLPALKYYMRIINDILLKIGNWRVTKQKSTVFLNQTQVFSLLFKKKFISLLLGASFRSHRCKNVISLIRRFIFP